MYSQFLALLNDNSLIHIEGNLFDDENDEEYDPETDQIHHKKEPIEEMKDLHVPK